MKKKNLPSQATMILLPGRLTLDRERLAIASAVEREMVQKFSFALEASDLFHAI
jgi:hypothetical protein